MLDRTAGAWRRLRSVADVSRVSAPVDGERQSLSAGLVRALLQNASVPGAGTVALNARAAFGGIAVDVSSWDRAVIHASYRRVVDDVLSEVRRAG